MSTQEPKTNKQRTKERMIRESVAVQVRYDGLTNKECAERYRLSQAEELIERFFAKDS